MLLQRAWNAIEKQTRFKKAWRHFFFRPNTFAEDHAHVQCPCHLVLFACFFPHQTPAWCKWLHVLPITQHLVLCKSTRCCTRRTQNHTRLWYNHPACLSTKKDKCVFCFPKKNYIFQITTFNVIPCTCKLTHWLQSFSLSFWKGRQVEERKWEITHSCSVDHRSDGPNPRPNLGKQCGLDFPNSWMSPLVPLTNVSVQSLFVCVFSCNSVTNSQQTSTQ